MQSSAERSAYRGSYRCKGLRMQVCLAMFGATEEASVAGVQREGKEW